MRTTPGASGMRCAKGCEEFALSLHPDKTRLIEFGRFAAADRKQRGLGKPETFKFLGFTFICGKSRQGASSSSGRPGATACGRSSRRSRRSCGDECTSQSLKQGRWLSRSSTGYFAYHAVPTNSRALSAFRHHVTDLWRRALRRRSQKDGVTWERMTKLADDWLPKPRILHPWPSMRFAVKHPR